ncbi:unnamed protein product [Phyllotreta striolata]|uniref:Uncharacterized protein n=1 Tax=Phyllotreta striolata TaxID=444603 RepID=A0A9P0DZ75_PHYSR|nr:unnamed protein product [Phyllotreta striolata]
MDDRFALMEFRARNEMRCLMARVRQQMNDMLSRFPMIGSGNASDEFPDLPGNFPPLNIDLGKGNTTSVTKIIDGHKVVINQTEYHNDDEHGSAFFKVSIIDVQPEETATEKDAEEVTPKETTKDRESLENTADNEIVKGKEAAPYLQSIESFDTVDYPRWMDVGQFAPIDDNSLNFEPVRDLSRDTYVNELLAQSGATPNPDAELVEIVPQGARSAPMRKYQYTSVRR